MVQPATDIVDIQNGPPADDVAIRPGGHHNPDGTVRQGRAVPQVPGIQLWQLAEPHHGPQRGGRH